MIWSVLMRRPIFGPEGGGASWITLYSILVFTSPTNFSESLPVYTNQISNYFELYKQACRLQQHPSWSWHCSRQRAPQPTTITHTTSQNTQNNLHELSVTDTVGMSTKPHAPPPPTPPPPPPPPPPTPPPIATHSTCSWSWSRDTTNEFVLRKITTKPWCR